jgi:hypothetical protein
MNAELTDPAWHPSEIDRLLYAEALAQPTGEDLILWVNWRKGDGSLLYLGVDARPC